MKLYWYELECGEIKQYEYEVKETAKQYKSLGRCFPYRCHMTIEKSNMGELLESWEAIYVFFTEKNLGKARDLFVKSQKRLIESNKDAIADIERENDELERQIERLEDMEVAE